jgi:hypothetical protein
MWPGGARRKEWARVELILGDAATIIKKKTEIFFCLLVLSISDSNENVTGVLAKFIRYRTFSTFF